MLTVDSSAKRPLPSFAMTLFLVCLPIGLMLLATAAELVFPAENQVRVILTSLGHPVFALTVAVLAASVLFRKACGFSRSEILTFTEQSISGIGMTLLVVAGGGGFARVLREAKVADASGELAGQLHLPPLLYAWMVAAFIRVATGSATVAITTAAGIMGPLLAANPLVNREMLVLSIGCGSLFLSHLNDGWILDREGKPGLTVGQTLRTWTITETLIGLTGLVLVLLLNSFL